MVDHTAPADAPADDAHADAFDVQGALVELQRLRDEVRELRQRLDEADSTTGTTGTITTDRRGTLEEPTQATRRNALKLAGAAVLGAVATSIDGGTAAADTGYVTGGAIAVGDVVRQQLNGSRPNEHGFIFATHGIPIPSNNSPTPAAVAVGNMDAAVSRGLYVETFASTGGIAIHARSLTSTDATGVLAEAFDLGVDGRGTATRGVGVRGTGGRIGVDGFSSSGLGGSFSGAAGALRVDGWEGRPPPLRATTSFADRVLETDASGELWYCVESGTPGTWRKIAGATTGGAFHPVDPIRVYDSRAAAPSPGVFAAGTARTISVANGRTLDTGAVSVTDVVPDGATAVAVNVTVTETKSSGYLALAPGSAASIGASSINWWTDGITVANGLVVKLDAIRTLKVFCAGAAGCETHAIVDVQGYWR